MVPQYVSFHPELSSEMLIDLTIESYHDEVGKTKQGDKSWSDVAMRMSPMGWVIGKYKVTMGPYLM